MPGSRGEFRRSCGGTGGDQAAGGRGDACRGSSDDAGAPGRTNYNSNGNANGNGNGNTNGSPNRKPQPNPGSSASTKPSYGSSPWI